MRIDDEKLMAYADDELDAAERAEVEAALATDPELARRVAAHRALRARLRASFDPVLAEPVPGRLGATLRAAPQSAPDRTARVLPFRRSSLGPRPALRALPLAASFVLGVIAWQLWVQRSPSGAIVERDGKLIASGALERALSAQLASEQPTDAAIRIGVSYRARDGEFCRTFAWRTANAAAGLACRHGNAWQLQVLAQGSAGSGTYRQAGSTLPEPVLAAVKASLSGEPLDARAEAAARARDWQP